MKKFNGNIQLMEDIVEAIASANCLARNPKWGSPIATATEPEQCALIAKMLKQKDPDYYDTISISPLGTGPGNLPKSEFIKLYEDSDYNSSNRFEEIRYEHPFIEMVPKKEKAKYSKIDMVLEFEDSYVLLEFKLLRPFGGKESMFDRYFTKQLFYFESARNKILSSSIPSDVKKLKGLAYSHIGRKKIEKLVVAIYYPSDFLCDKNKFLDENEFKKVIKGHCKKNGLDDNLISSILTQNKINKTPVHPLQEIKLNILNNLFAKCNREIKIDKYVRLLDRVFKIEGVDNVSLVKPKSKRKFMRKLIWDDKKFSLVKNSVQENSNYSFFFHKHVRLFAWEVN